MTALEQLEEVNRIINDLRPILDEAIDQGEVYTGGLHYVMGRLLLEKKELENITERKEESNGRE